MKRKNRAATTSAKDVAHCKPQQSAEYQLSVQESIERGSSGLADRRSTKIASRRAYVPSAYRGIYDKAMKGKSFRAAIKSFCLECLGWKKNDIRGCTALVCQFWLFRPYQEFAQSAQKGRDIGAESSNDAGEGR